MQELTQSGSLPLSPWWRHGTLLVMIFGFSVLTVVTVLTYTNAPPIPRQFRMLLSGSQATRRTASRPSAVSSPGSPVAPTRKS